MDHLERIDELNLARPYLNSNYYWKRLKELKEQGNEPIEDNLIIDKESDNG